jgi:hypothetical protein
VLVFDKVLVTADEQIALFALRTHISRGQTSGGGLLEFECHTEASQ